MYDFYLFESELVCYSAYIYRSFDVWLCGNMVSKWYYYLAICLSCRMAVQWYVYLVVWLSGWVKVMYKPVLYYRLKLLDIHLQCNDADEHVFKKNRQWHCQEDNCNIQSRHVVILMLFHACRFYNYMLTKVCFNCFLFICLDSKHSKKPRIAIPQTYTSMNI